jgi:hypothetical protein
MHFYAKTENGIEPKHFVPMTKNPNELRPSRVTDAKKAAKGGEIWYASVTTVMDVLDKGGLVNWKIDQHLETVWQVIKGMIYADGYEHAKDFDEFKSLIKNETEKRMDLAPQAGTDIHALLEQHLFSGKIPVGITDTEHKIIRNVEQAILDNCGKIEWEKEKYFINEEHGYAGCIDLVSPSWVIDYKTKQTAEKFKPKKMAFTDHYRQLAAYGKSACKENFKAANIFICIENGEVDFHQHTEENIEHGFADFLDCLNIFKRNKYDAGVL